ncbi:ABC transporter permease [Fibrella sp. HMF5335]|uniref:ABC transporter permease n=1 Tax=Fibrella rubiginis TaxID=2817060 RepID=A0A939K846_9BACT|nr:FtsX-like permease family protein [Fibrella rubiginis]MBO0939340.1 ABC transporter permease [Fibrella rubiginis]
MMNRTLNQMAWRNIWRNKTRSLVFMGAALLGFAVALFTLNTMKAIAAQRLRDAINVQTSDVQVHRKGFVDDHELTYTLPQADALITRLRQTSGVAVVAKRLVVNGVVTAPDNNLVGEIKGVVPRDENRLSVLGDFLVEGGPLTDDGRSPILISRRTADKLHVRLKSKLVITVKAANGDLAGGVFRVVGIFATPSTPFDENTVLVRYNDLAALTGVTAPHELAVKLTNPSQLAEVKAAINAGMPAGTQLDDWKVLLPELFAFDGFINMVGILFTLIISLGLGFSLMNTMNMIVAERTRELGMLRAIGQSRWSVFRMLIAECVLMMLIGAIGGVLLGTVFIGLAARYGIRISEGLGMLGIRPVMYPTLDPALLFVILGLATLLTLLISLVPASRILRLNLAQALKQ